jgi:hypothetical protein
MMVCRIEPREQAGRGVARCGFGLAHDDVNAQTEVQRAMRTATR